MSESEAWRTITGIAAGIDRIDAHLSRLEAKVGDLAATVERLAVDRLAVDELAVSGSGTGPGAALDPGGTGPGDGSDMDARVIAEVVALCRDHPRWAVWLAVPEGAWAAARPAGSHPPGPGTPMIWVDGRTPAELAARMKRADVALASGQGHVSGG